MWNVEDFDIKKNSREGEWCQLVNPKTGEDLEIEIDGVIKKSRVKMLGPKSEAGIKAKAEAEKANREHEAKLASFEKKGKTYFPSEDEIEKAERKDIAYLKAMAIEWEGIPDGKGGEAKFTEAEKDRIFAADGIRWPLIMWTINPQNFMHG